MSWRTVNLRYKVSAAKRDARLRIYWCNTLRVRVLHRALFGEERLRFVGLDQKPLWPTQRTPPRPWRCEGRHESR